MRKLQIVLYILAAIPISTGLLDLSLGLAANRPLGADLLPELLSDSLINSQYRYLGAIWLGFGLLLIMVARQLPKSSGLLRVLLWSVFLGGVGRLITLAQFGMPQTTAGAVFIPATIAIETVGMLTLLWWHTRLCKVT